jgi:hypothetical protein
MNAPNDGPILVEQMLRGFRVAPGRIAPETRALVEALRCEIDETVVRAQRNLDRQRAEEVGHERELIYAGGHREVE